MNLENLLETTRIFLQEDSEGYWTDKELIRYLNEADLRVLIDIKGGDVFRTTNSVAGQQVYILPEYTIEVNMASYDGKSLRRLYGHSDVLTGHSGSPHSYWLPTHSNRIYIEPKPTESGKEIKLHGRFKGPDMAYGNDIPESPDVLHMALVYWASMLAWQKRKDIEQASSFASLYQNVLNNWDGPVDSGPVYSLRMV